MGDCRYRLTEQPSNTMTCNPYPSGKFFTRCVVQFSTTEGGPLRLVWYSRAQLGGTPQRIFSGFTTKNTVSRVESELIIQIKDTVSFCDGFSAYYCQISFYNGTLLSRSQEVYLFPQYAFSNALKMCDEQSIQSSQVTQCIDPQFSMAEQTTTFPSLSMTTATPFSATSQQTTNPPSKVTTLSSTSMSPLESTTLPVTTKTLTMTTERSLPMTESSSSTENLLETTTVPSTTIVSTTDTMTTSLQSMTTSSSALPITKSSSLTSETYLVASTHPLVTENPPQITKHSPSTTEVSPLTTSSPLTTESSQIITESLPPTTNTSPIISTTPDSLPSPQSGSQGASTAPQPPQQPQSQAVTSPPTNRDPISSSDPSAESEIGSGRFDDEALLFLTLGAAAFLLILIGCIVFCLCLWSDQCRQCGYEICCSDECCCLCSCCLCLDDI